MRADERVRWAQVSRASVDARAHSRAEISGGGVSKLFEPAVRRATQIAVVARRDCPQLTEARATDYGLVRC